jgi:hypothetical protein
MTNTWWVSSAAFPASKFHDIMLGCSLWHFKKDTPTIQNKDTPESWWDKWLLYQNITPQCWEDIHNSRQYNQDGIRTDSFGEVPLVEVAVIGCHSRRRGRRRNRTGEGPGGGACGRTGRSWKTEHGDSHRWEKLRGVEGVMASLQGWRWRGTTERRRRRRGLWREREIGWRGESREGYPNRTSGFLKRFSARRWTDKRKTGGGTMDEKRSTEDGTRAWWRTEHICSF